MYERQADIQKAGVVEKGESSGDDGLKSEVKTDVAGGNDVREENVIDSGDNVIDNTVVSGGDSGNNDVAGVDEGPGEPGVVDED